MVDGQVIQVMDHVLQRKLFLLKLLKLKYILDVIMEHKYVHVIAIILYHNMEVIENILLILFFFIKNISIGAQCVGASIDTIACATNNNCPSIIIL
jgi:hypothetical protein